MATDEQKAIASSAKAGWEKDISTGRTYSDPSYAVSALTESVTRRMRKQGDEAAAKIVRKQSRKSGSK